jgi:hypothetical protein
MLNHDLECRVARSHFIRQFRCPSGDGLYLTARSTIEFAQQYGLNPSAPHSEIRASNRDRGLGLEIPRINHQVGQGKRSGLIAEIPQFRAQAAVEPVPSGEYYCL